MMPTTTGSAGEGGATAPNATPLSKRLWIEAKEKLKKEKPGVFKALEKLEGAMPTGDVLSLVQKVEEVTEQRKSQMELNQSSLPKFIRKDDQKIRDSMGKIFSCARFLKNLLQGAPDSDPTGHAKMAWIPFSLVIDVSLDTMNYDVPVAHPFKLWHANPAPLLSR
jgi:hypothetical protein